MIAHSLNRFRGFIVVQAFKTDVCDGFPLRHLFGDCHIYLFTFLSEQRPGIINGERRNAAIVQSPELVAAGDEVRSYRLCTPEAVPDSTLVLSTSAANARDS